MTALKRRIRDGTVSVHAQRLVPAGLVVAALDVDKPRPQQKLAYGLVVVAALVSEKIGRVRAMPGAGVQQQLLQPRAAACFFPHPLSAVEELCVARGIGHQPLLDVRDDDAKAPAGPEDAAQL